MALADRFDVRERVGIGATGEVFRAFDKLRGTEVALKRLHEHLVADPWSRDRFRFEAALSTRIQGEHVVRCLDAGVDEDDRPYLVLEWLEGRDLAERLKSERPTVQDAIEIARQAALGLQAMHEAGIVHRDVKPRNLFIADVHQEKPFVVKLLDLGVAQEANGDRPEACALGTPFYMSPEQARANASVGPASDLFSLGVVFFELLTGRRPFTGQTTFCLLAKITLQVRPWLSEVWPDAPPAFDVFFERALAMDPTARFSSAREMADELERLALVNLDAFESRDSRDIPFFETNPDHLVAVIFGRMPLSSSVDRCRDFVRSIVEAHDGSVVSLLGRCIVASFDGWGADGLVSAADAVLVLATRIPGGRWSLVSGAALPEGAGLSESIIDRGTRALERARTSVNEPTVRIDDETANVLEEHYVIEGSSGVLSLRSVRETR